MNDLIQCIMLTLIAVFLSGCARSLNSIADLMEAAQKTEQDKKRVTL